MSGLEFFASLVRSLAWPAAVAFGLWLFRSPFAGLIERVIKVKGPGFEVDAIENAVRRTLVAHDILEAEVTAAAS